jgi:hypothetical protein
MTRIFFKNLHTRRLLPVIALSILIMLCAQVSRAQSKAEIKNVDFSVRNDSMFVVYNLDKAGKQERFTISLKVATASGKEIHPQATSGDVGNNITGGKSKKMIWDIKKDNIFINEGISVEVIAEPVIPETKFVHRGTAVLLSEVLPGLGITKLNNGGPYWIMAIAFYGCAAGSYLYYNSAESNYDKYLESVVENDRNKLYNKTQNYNTISDVLMYTAGAVWLGNMIWTLACPNKTKPNSKGMSFSGGYDPIAKAPVFVIKYGF